MGRLAKEERSKKGQKVEWKGLTCGAVLRSVQQGERPRQRHSTKEPSVNQEWSFIRIQAVLSG